MRQAFHISGGHGSILQVWENGTLEIDADTVSDDDHEVVNNFIRSDEWDNVDWQDEPWASDLSMEELEEYVGA